MYADLRDAVRRVNQRRDCPEYLRDAHQMYDAGLVALADRYADRADCPDYLRTLAKDTARDAFGED